MTINTKKVEGRRQLRYESLDDLLADAQQLASTDVRELGNWSQGQIYEHLAKSLDSCIDGVDFSLPAPVRWMLTLFMKRKFLYDKIPAGFSSPKGPLTPDEISVQAAFESLQKAISRQKNESSRVKHPGFGNLSRAEWNDFNLRHAELHMSFLTD